MIKAAKNVFGFYLTWIIRFYTSTWRPCQLKRFQLFKAKGDKPYTKFKIQNRTMVTDALRLLDLTITLK